MSRVWWADRFAGFFFGFRHELLGLLGELLVRYMTKVVVDGTDDMAARMGSQEFAHSLQ